MKKRLKELKRINAKYNTKDFQMIEIPADFVKNPTEEQITGLKVGSMLTEKTIKQLYTKDFLKEEIKYILHTEPVFSRKGSNVSVMSHLRWFDRNWLNSFVKHVFSIINNFEIKPYAIEIHPGKFLRGKNNIKSFSNAIRLLNDEYTSKYSDDILIFIENRTGQYLKDGEDIDEFWAYFKRNHENLIEKVGIVLDIQQFYTVNRENFTSELLKIPEDSLYGTHIHYKHQNPSLNDEIPWKEVSKKFITLSRSKQPFHVLPEVHHAKQVEDTYNFCKKVLNI